MSIHSLIGLILPQMAHYIYCYYRVCGDKPGKTVVEFAVPTGACGNITGLRMNSIFGRIPIN